jgi:protein-S-isoprenylcysteine O-methyltransferase Ste14
VARFLVAVEKYVLPLVFAFLAWVRFQYLQDQYMAWRSIESHPVIRAFMPGTFFADTARQFLIFTLLAFTVVTLLFNRPAVSLPDKLKHVMVPLAGSYYVALYAAIRYFPPWMRENVLADGLRGPAAVAGLGLSIVGYAIAIWAMIYLRRSFALFVSVRDVVTRGPYRLVRHPIYSGYLLDAAGLLLTSGSIGMLILCAGHVTLLVIRARMEEDMLAETDPAYRSYFGRTGAFFPQF